MNTIAFTVGPGQALFVTSDAHRLRVHRVMDHVRQNLTGDLSLESLARVAHASPYHFHRIFKVVTGQTLSSFTQRARLERAAYLMMASPDRPLGSIALEAGFSEQSDLSRVFRRHYGMAPSAWDRKTRLGDAVVADYDERLKEAKKTTSPMTPRVVDYPACRLAYVRVQTPFVGDALEQGYVHLVDWLSARGVDPRGCRLLGWSWDNYETTPLDQVRFNFGFEVSEAIEAADDIGIEIFPAMKAVAVHCQGGLPQIAVAWDVLYEQWLPNSSYQPADWPGIKRFRVHPDVLGWSTWDVDCTIAIEPLLP